MPAAEPFDLSGRIAPVTGAEMPVDAGWSLS
jgi:hypothetical protein